MVTRLYVCFHTGCMCYAAYLSELQLRNTCTKSNCYVTLCPPEMIMFDISSNPWPFIMLLPFFASLSLFSCSTIRHHLPSTLYLSFFCLLSAHSSIPLSFFFLCCLYCSIPFSFQEPIHPCITHSVTCWWITVDVLSLTWWEISVTFSKGHHMNTQQTDALCPVPCTLACTHKGTHFHLTLSSGANEGTVKDLYTFPCLSFCSCLPSRFFFLNYKKRHSPLQHIPCIHFSLIIPSGFCLCIFLVRPVEILLLFAVLNFFFPFLLLIFVLSGQVCFCQKVHAPKGICSSNTLCMYVNVCISLVLATSLF